MTGTPQVMDALNRGDQVRLARADLFRQVREGRADLLDVLASPPPEIERASLLDVITRTTRQGHGRSPDVLDELGAAAVKDDINLLVQVGRSSSRQRAWVAERVVRRPGGRVTVRPGG